MTKRTVADDRGMFWNRMHTCGSLPKAALTAAMQCKALDRDLHQGSSHCVPRSALPRFE